jgi:hypothetical protein
MLEEFLNKGFCIIPNVISSKLIKNLRREETIVNAHHGFDYEKNYITGMPQKDNYLQYTTDEISLQLSEEIKGCVEKYIPTNFKSYGKGCFVCQKPGWDLINPHLDTPNRFNKFNKTKDLLGIHVFIPLEKFDSQTGATAFLPHSQNYFIDHWNAIEGRYQDLFLDNYEQVECNIGDLILFNTRCLHSSMPNMSNTLRRALSITYTRKDIFEQLKKLVIEEDNIYNKKMKTGEDMITRDVE